MNTLVLAFAVAIFGGLVLFLGVRFVHVYAERTEVMRCATSQES